MWKSKGSENYIFYYHENSYAEKDIDKVIEIQENCYDYICQVMGEKPKIKLKYFLCNSPEEVGEMYGDNEPCNGFTKMPNEIYAVYNRNIKCIGYHEDAHVISYNSLSRPPINFIRQGLAMYFDKTWWGVSNFAWTLYFFQNRRLPKLEDLMDNSSFHKYSYAVTYPVSGAFTEYLISTFGIESYKKLYSNINDDFSVCVRSVFGESLIQIENNFIKYLKSISVSNSVFSIIETELKEKGLFDKV
ncbi:hypothetical protein [Sporosalibacterium faouarense]|uniref:hypothetical protein n=1 Tax=Sporosalibacterium faouarense TaxID=516123 RepID=UPI00192C6E3A|nr:hypothetical protein [Sporosalibacterium faouarense]